MPSQQLYASNVSVNIGEALSARTKDPLWFLARQWQLGEFAAEDAGSPVAVHVTTSTSPVMTPSHTWRFGCGRWRRSSARRPRWPAPC